MGCGFRGSFGLFLDERRGWAEVVADVDEEWVADDWFAVGDGAGWTG